jgi:prepilin-type N-terminal cleavage/methylation domain-containing protein
MKKTQGITLIELLVVIAIIGIIAALSVQLLGNNAERSTRESQAGFISSLERVRSLVIRYNVSYILDIASDKKSYAFTPRDLAGTAPSNVPTISGQMNYALLEVGVGSVPGRIYTAPYARLGGTGAAPRCFEIVGQNNYRAVVSLVGVTGKVIARNLVRSITSGC